VPSVPSIPDLPESLTEREFWSLAGDMEHEKLDFKKGADYLKDVIPAMAMTDGGIILLGVAEDRSLTGRSLTQKIHDTVKRSGNGCGVDVGVKEIDVDGIKLTVVEVPAVTGRVVTTTDGRLLHRVGSDSQPLVGDALARFVRERDSKPSEEAALDRFVPADFDLGLINSALRSAARPQARRNSILRGLRDLRLTDRSADGEEHITAAAAILFATNPTTYVKGAAVQVVRRVGVNSGPGPTSLRQHVEGPIAVVLDRVLELVAASTDQFEVVVGSHREVLPQYPAAVLREALLNALAHRDYGLQGATVDLTIFDDRLEIQSPGPLPGHITLENLRDEHYSRNGRVMSVLRLLNLVEEYGEGVDRMYDEMAARLMEPPRFDVSPSSVTVRLFNRFLVSVEDQAWLALLGQFDLSPEERRLLLLARDEDGVTPRRLRDALRSENVRPLLQSATAKGLVVRVGETGGSRYLLSDEIILRAGSSGLEARSRQRQIILDEVRRTGSVSTAEAADLTGEEMSVVRHLLNDLASAGAVTARGKTRARRYYAH
jgi:ATP-dependent DNA helicase RecG